MCSEFLCNFSISVCFSLKAGTAFGLAVCHVVDLKKKTTLCIVIFIFICIQDVLVNLYVLGNSVLYCYCIIPCFAISIYLGNYTTIFVWLLSCLVTAFECTLFPVWLLSCLVTAFECTLFPVWLLSCLVTAFECTLFPVLSSI